MKLQLWMRWSITNGCGFLLGTGIHLAISLVTLHQPEGLPAAMRGLIQQFGLSALALGLCLVQHMLLQLFVRIPWRDIVLQTGLAVSAFWIGYYAQRMPFLHLALLFILGILTGWVLLHRPGEWRRWMWISSAGFLAGTLVEIGACLPAHIAVWSYLGCFAGVASGALTGWQLAHSLNPIAATERPVPHTLSLHFLLS